MVKKQKRFAVIVKNVNRYSLQVVSAINATEAILYVFGPQEDEKPSLVQGRFDPDELFWTAGKVRGLSNIWQTAMFDHLDRLYHVIVVGVQSRKVHAGSSTRLYTGIGFCSGAYEYIQIEATNEYDAAEQYIRKFDYNRLVNEGQVPRELVRIVRNLRKNGKLRRLEEGIWLTRFRAAQRLFELTLLRTRR